MHAAHVTPDFLQGGDRLAGAVQDHVGRIEVDEQVVTLYIMNELQQRVGRFLAGLQVQGLAVLFAMVAQVARHRQHLLIQRRRGFVRHKADVQCHDRYAQQFREIGDFLHFLSARSPRFRRHQAHGFGDRGNIGIAFSREAAKHRGQRDAVIPQFGEELFAALRRARALVRGMKLNRRHAQIAGDFQLNPQPGIEAGKHADRPFFHVETPCMTGNPKHEARNPKQIQITNESMLETSSPHRGFEPLNFVLRICFVFRASYFVFAVRYA